jgi:hypothetical protein
MIKIYLYIYDDIMGIICHNVFDDTRYITLKKITFNYFNILLIPYFLKII